MVKIVVLTRQIKLELGRGVSGGARLDDILIQTSPDAEIFIVRCQTEPRRRPYVEAAYFNRDQAEAAIIDKSAQASGQRRYYLISGTAKDLRNGTVSDSNVGLLDEVEILRVYSSLADDLLATGRD